MHTTTPFFLPEKNAMSLVTKNKSADPAYQQEQSIGQSAVKNTFQERKSKQGMFIMTTAEYLEKMNEGLKVNFKF